MFKITKEVSSCVHTINTPLETSPLTKTLRSFAQIDTINPKQDEERKRKTFYSFSKRGQERKQSFKMQTSSRLSTAKLGSING